MKKIIKISFLLLAIAAFFSNQSLAQDKLGYVSPELLLLKMPERISADDQVTTLSKSFESQITSKINALKIKEEALYKEIEGGTLSPQTIRERKTALQTELQGIQKFEQKATEDVQTKRQQLYAPILEKIRTAIETVAKEQGFTMVIDSSVGALLDAADDTNLTPSVAQKLGISLD